MEILDLYDDNFKYLNETIIRGTKPDSGKNIMLSIVFIKNSDNKYLIQKTSKEKGNMYASTGGHVKHNENAEDTIIRELEEELSIKININELKKIIIFKYPNRSCIFNVYLLEKDIDINKIKLQYEEVDKIEWMTISEIENKIDSASFLESHAYIFNNYIKD